MRKGQRVKMLNGGAFKGYTGTIDYIGVDGSFSIKGETSTLHIFVIKDRSRAIVKELGLIDSMFNIQCYVCKMYPFEIRYDSSYIWPIYHCPECKVEDSINGWFKKILYKIGLIG